MTDATPQPAAPQPVAPQPVPAGPLTPAEDKQWATFAHFGGILGLLPSLIIFLVFKDRGALTRQESKEALNWQITWIGAFIILQIVVAIITGIAVAVTLGSGSYNAYAGLSIVTGLLSFIAWIPYLANIVFSIIGGVKVNGGGAYRYPVAIRLVK